MHFQRVQALAKKQEYLRFPVKVGQQLEIHEYIGEWDIKRIWKFKCLVVAVHNPQNHDGSFTVIGETSGIKIEKTYPVSFPRFAKVILLDEFKVRKSKIYYIKDKVGKDARMKSLITKDARGSEIQAVAC